MRQYEPVSGRFLGRDPEPARRNQLYYYARNNPATYIDPKGTTDIVPGISVRVWSAKIQPCGGFEYTFGFSLTMRAPCKGYFVQRIVSRGTMFDCSGNDITPNNFNFEFWEAWEVEKGSREFTPELNTDVWLFPDNPDTFGWHFVSGEVRFYCESVTGFLGTYSPNPADPNPQGAKWTRGYHKAGTNDPARQSHGLPSTSNPADAQFWDRYTGVPAFRSVFTMWNCCKGQVWWWPHMVFGYGQADSPSVDTDPSPTKILPMAPDERRRLSAATSRRGELYALHPCEVCGNGG